MVSKFPPMKIVFRGAMKVNLVPYEIIRAISTQGCAHLSDFSERRLSSGAHTREVQYGPIGVLRALSVRNAGFGKGIVMEKIVSRLSRPSPTQLREVFDAPRKNLKEALLSP